MTDNAIDIKEIRIAIILNTLTDDQFSTSDATAKTNQSTNVIKAKTPKNTKEEAVNPLVIPIAIENTMYTTRITIAIVLLFDL